MWNLYANDKQSPLSFVERLLEEALQASTSNLNQFFHMQLKYSLCSPPLAFTTLEKDWWLGLPTSKPPKEARSAQPWSSVPSMTWEKLNELHVQTNFLKIKINQTSDYWHIVIYCDLYIMYMHIYIYIHVYVYWIWRLSWRDQLQKRERVLLMK